MSLRARSLAPMAIVIARARRTPGRWSLTVLGLALAAAFAGTVAAEATIAGDRGAHAALLAIPSSDRVVRVTWPGLLTPSVQRSARGLLDRLIKGPQTEIALLNPVRLGGLVVRPAAIEPLRRWTDRSSPGACSARTCPMLLAGGGSSGAVKLAQASHRALDGPGVRVPIDGEVRLSSTAPLGFAPAAGSGGPPLLLTGDVAGLERLAGLSGVYRSHSWLTPVPTGSVHSWQLAGLQRRLQQATAALQLSGTGFSLSAPFAGLEAARAQADAAPQRLLLAGGGGVAAIGLFIVLVAGALRRDEHAELERLRAAGASAVQCKAFVVGEAALVCAAGVALGAALSLGAGAILCLRTGAPVGGVLAHSLLTASAAAAMATVWLSATALLSLLLLSDGGRIGDLLAVAAVAALALALADSSDLGGPLAVLLAPLCCLAAGVIVFRGAAAALRGGERIARHGPILVRLALTSLARAPGAPALAIAFIAVSTGLGGFALSYRATLLRGAADQAANRVPLDGLVAAGPSFLTPLALAPLSRWRSIAGGEAFPVRRTDADFISGGASVSVPAIGLPASALMRLHGWRPADASAPLAALARRLSFPGAPRMPGPSLPAGTRSIWLSASATGVAVSVNAVLRGRGDTVVQVPLGQAGGPLRALHARIPQGRWELQALELQESAGLELTNGHQNSENPAAATQFETSVRLGGVRAAGRADRQLARIGLAGWRAVGAASDAHRRGGNIALTFAASGQPGVLRPRQPTDQRPVPVLVDAQTAAAAGRGGFLALTVDGLPLRARVVGVLSRFPTVSSGSAGFVVADEPALAAALDAQLPGQGRGDELWISSSHLARLRAALRQGRLAQLSATFRGEVQRTLGAAPVERGVLDTLVAAAIVTGVLTVVGLLVALLGGGRDERVEYDLVAQGVGPGGLRRELVARMMLAATAGVLSGLAVAGALTRLAVVSVSAAGTSGRPSPPLVSVSPWAELCLWALGLLVALAVASLLVTRSLSPVSRDR